MHLNMSYSEVKILPARYRRWFLDRIVKHFKDQKQRYEKVKDSANDHDQKNTLSEFEKQVNSKFT